MWITFRSISIHRAIPESDYVTLGTIRYGVKLSQECISSNSSRCAHSVPCNTVQSPNTCSAKSFTSNSNDSKWPNKFDGTRQINDKNPHQCLQTPAVAVCDTDSSSDVNSVNGSCCLNATKCSLPWNRRLVHMTEKQRKPNESCK